MIKMSEYAKRRAALVRQVGAKGIVILPAAAEVHRNGDYHFPYRQHSDFYYLTGFEEPHAVMVLLPKRKNGEFILFTREKNRAEEIWNGRRAGLSGACLKFGADHAYAITELESRLPELLEDREEVHYTLGIDTAFDTLLLNAINKIRGKIRSGIQPPLSFVDVSATIHEMRLMKSPAEIAVMRKAATISAHAHERAMRFCKPGCYEYQLEAELIHEFQSQGARAVAYTSIVGGGENSCILHYNQNNQKIQNGDIVLIDAGCEYQNYASDITRTFPANGKFSAEQRAIYEIVLAAQLAGIAAVRSGALFDAMQTAIVKVITQGLLDLGILKGRLSDLIEKKAYFDYYMHKSGHWLGLDVHDVGYYKINNKWRALKPGMVLTVEPGIYIPADSKANKRWHHIGVRIEDDVLVTKQGCDILSKDAPKLIADIEAIMRHE